MQLLFHNSHNNTAQHTGISGDFTTAATFQILQNFKQMAPLKNDYCAKADCLATTKFTLKAARPARSHLEDKVKLIHLTLHTLHFISSWTLWGTVSVCINAAPILTQIPSLYHRWATATPIEPKSPQIKDFVVPQMDLVGNLQSELNEEFSCSSFFAAFHKKPYCSIDPFWLSSSITCSSQ